MCKLFYSYFIGCIFLYNCKQHISKTFKEYIPGTEEYNKIVEEYNKIKNNLKKLNKYLDF